MISFLIILVIRFAAPAVGGKVKVNNNPQIQVTTSFEAFDARIMDAWSYGGGRQWVIQNDSFHPFAGRAFGGATRGSIKGTSIFGSGYPYGGTYNSTVAGRPFPFGAWPIYWEDNFMGSDEYGPQYDGIRPGGQLVTIPVKSQPNHGNITEDDIYYTIGDRDSSLAIMVSFVTWCKAVPTWPSKFQPASTNSTAKVENVINYYRASTFALASPNYNNTLARNAPTDPSNSNPLPDTIKYSQFWQCLDGVVSNALIIMNPPPPNPTPIGVTLGIVFAIFGIPILVALSWCFEDSISSRFDAIKRRVERGKAAKRAAKRAAAERRNAASAYENYP
jgi:hypothetical protein